MERVGALVQIRNRPGRFAAVSPGTAQALADGQMKLFLTPAGTVEVETLTRYRKHLASYDPFYRVVFIAVDLEGNLVLDS